MNDPEIDAAEVCEAFANGFMLNGRFRDAIDLLNTWMAAYPQDAQPHYMVGLIRKHLGDLENAEQSFLQALEALPDHHPSALGPGRPARRTQTSRGGPEVLRACCRVG